MSDRVELLLEAERRGILPADKQPLLEEARTRGLLPASTPTPTPSEPPNRELSNSPRPHGILEEGVSGYTLGGSGHIAAAAGSLVRTGRDLFEDGTFTPGKHYGDALDEFQARQDRYRDENPKAAIAANVAGGVASAVTTPLRTLMALKSGAPVLSNVARSGGQGGVVGGVAGALNSRGETTKEIGGDAGFSALMGAGIGAAAPAAGEGLRQLLTAKVARQASSNLGVSRPAQTVLTRAMDADGSFSGKGAANLARAGDDAMLADAGPNARTLLDTSIQRSGRAGTIAREAIEDRATRANQTMTGALDDTLGNSGGVPATTRPTLNPLYERAYDTPIDYASEVGRRLESAVVSRVPPKAIKAANDLMRLEGHASRQILADIADDGSVAFRQMPDVRQLDYITRGLNEVAERANGAGKLGGTTQLGRASSNLSRQIRRDLKEAVPAYGDALDAASGLIREGKAREFGETLLSTRVSRTDAGDILEGMSKAERFNAAQGVRLAIDDTLANTRRAMMDTNMDAREAVALARNLSSRANREKVSALIGNEAADSLFEQLDRATTALDLRASVAGNSRTFARQSMDDIIQREVDGGVVGRLRDGKPLDGAQSAFQRLMRRGPETLQAKGDAIREEIARVLTDKRGPEALRALEGLRTVAQQQDPATVRAVEAAIQRLTPSSPLLLEQLPVGG